MSTDGRMRLLVVAQPLVAGVPRHVIDLLPGTLAAGWEVTVACPVASILWDEAGRLGLERVATNPSRSPGPRDVVDLVRLVLLVRRADVVHAHSSKSGFVVRLAARVAGRHGRTIFTPHGWSFWAFPTGAAGRLYLALERAAARWCARIICVARHERDAALALGVGRPDQYRVVPNGVDLARLRAAGERVPDRIVMVARLAPPRLPVLAVEALARLRETSRPSATLDLVGDGPLRGEVEAAVRRHGLEGAVAVLGARDDVAELLVRASCALHLSTYEGASLGVLEAMGSGLPVIASRLGGMDEIVEDGSTGMLVPNDARSVADALERVLGRPDGGAALGAAGEARARSRFSTTAMTAATLAVYDEVRRHR